MGKNEDSFVGEAMTAYAVNTVSIHEAKTNFSKLVKRAAAGDTIYIGAYGKPEAVLTAVNQREISAKKRAGIFGCMKGKGELKEGWDDPWTEEELDEMFYSMRGLEDFEKK